MALNHFISAVITNLIKGSGVTIRSWSSKEILKYKNITQIFVAHTSEQNYFPETKKY